MADGQGNKRHKAVVAGLVLVLVLAAAISLYFNLTSLTRSTLERLASDTLGAPVTIGDISISAADQQVIIENLLIGNPPEFGPGTAIRVRYVTIEAESLSRQRLIFNMIEVGGAQIDLVMRNGTSNLNQLSRNAREDAALERKTIEAISDQPPATVLIHNFEMSDTQINADTPVVLPMIRVQAIGDEQDGVLAAEAIAIILTTIEAALAPAMLQ